MPYSPLHFRNSSMTTTDRVVRGLGVFSIALGAAELLFPGLISRSLGVRNKGIVRAYGAREIATGIGAMQPHATTAMWGRVIGDVLDLGTLALATDRKRPATKNATAAVLAIGVVDLLVATMLTRQNARTGRPRDYSDRSGFPGGLAAARGAATAHRARGDFGTSTSSAAEI